jgi:hypothetical protein
MHIYSIETEEEDRLLQLAKSDIASEFLISDLKYQNHSVLNCDPVGAVDF